MKIIASLTTIPSRIDLFLPTLQSIVNQTIAVDSIEINIPYIFKRTGETYKIPEWLLNLEQDSKNSKCKIQIFRTEDYGAITKVAPTLIRHKDDVDTYVWSLDDDYMYPVNMLAVLYREFIPERNYVLSHSCGYWKCNISSRECEGYLSTRKEGYAAFLEGFATVLYPTSIIKDDFEKYIIMTSETLDCRNSDDIIISNYLSMKNVKIYNCSFPYSSTKQLFLDLTLPHSQSKDSLHKQGGGNQERYIRVFNWLKSHNLNSWVAQLPA